MVLSVTTFGDNQQAPSILAETFVPDQLIAGGGAGLVTKSVTITGGVDLVRGSLLGMVTDIAGAAVAKGGNTGNGTVTAITAGADAVPGVYTITYTAPTTFTVSDPNGLALPNGVNGAYVSNELNFTAAAGGTAFVAGDAFTIPFTGGGFKLSVSTAADGSQKPVAILADAALCATNGADQITGVYLQGEFNANAMTYGAGWNADSAEMAFRLGGFPIYLKNVGTLDLTYADPF